MKKKKPKKLQRWRMPCSLWSQFSEYIRRRDKGKCYTCERVDDWKHKRFAGHFIDRSIGGFKLYYDPQNVHAQCYYCNDRLSGNKAKYALHLIRDYGPDIIEKLHSRQYPVIKVQPSDIEELKERVKRDLELLNQLECQKM